MLLDQDAADAAAVWTVYADWQSPASFLPTTSHLYPDVCGKQGKHWQDWSKCYSATG